MKTLREIIIENVGDDIADDEYLSELGYDNDTLDTPPLAQAQLMSRYGYDTVYKLQEGYHLSTSTAEFYVDPGEGEGVIEDIEALSPEEWVLRKRERRTKIETLELIETALLQGQTVKINCPLFYASVTICSQARRPEWYQFDNGSEFHYFQIGETMHQIDNILKQKPAPTYLFVAE